MEIKIRNRAWFMQVIAIAMFLFLVWAYGKLGWNLPQTVQRNVVQSRGSILAADGTILAHSVGGKRSYPQDKLAGQLLGMMGATEGLEGLEAAYDSQLKNGENLQLTIMPQVQAVAEQALAKAVPEHLAEYGMVVVMETHTGKILAAANYPAFNPNEWRKYDSSVIKNRAFLDAYEPGSVIKGLVVASAMNEGLTTPETVYNTPMQRFVGGRWGSTIHDAVGHPSMLTTRQVLRYSSNVGMSHIVENFPSERLYDYFMRYGFGDYADMPTVNAAKGVVQPLRRWDTLVRTTNSFGQGISATTLQLAAAFNALGNDGLYLAPRLVSNERVGERREVLRPETARATRTMLQAVVQEGIPHAASIKGYTLAGKTGTAQVVVDGAYSDTIYNATFAGFVPADEPQVTIMVMVHGAKKDHHGSQLAAPIYREIAADLISMWATAPAEE